MEIEKIIRMLAVFIVVAAFALSVAARLLFPEASHLSDTPLLEARTAAAAGTADPLGLRHLARRPALRKAKRKHKRIIP